MATIIQEQHRGNHDRHQRWARFECADLFARSGELHTQGVSQRQAAKVLDVSRSTLQAWRAYQEPLAEWPTVVAFFHRPAGLAFLHRLVLARHVVCVEVGACGMRLVCLFLKRTGRTRCVGASYGTPQQVNRHVAEALVAYQREETTRLAQEMPPQEIPATQDEPLTGGLCLVAIEAVSTYSLLEPTAEARDQDPWNALMEDALAGLNCQGIHSTSAEAPGLLAYVEQPLGAQHSPDLFHVPHELSQAVVAPMAAKQRAAEKAVTTAAVQRNRVQAHPQHAGGLPERRGPGRPPQVTPGLAQTEQEGAVARQERQRLAQSREQIGQGMRAMGYAYHFVDLDRGVRRNGQLMVSDLQHQIDTVRTIAQQEGLSQACFDLASRKPSVLCPQCRRLSSWSRGMCASRSNDWSGHRRSPSPCMRV